MTVDEAIETLALMLAVGLVARVVADLSRVPPMLLLVAAGALVGPSVLGIVDAPLTSDGMQLLLTLGVSFVLFHGGLQLSIAVLRRTALGLVLLVVPGVVVTAAVTGAIAASAFGVPLVAGLMIGAALAPTDPAILIPLFDRLRLRPRVAQMIVAESALNDPTGAVLALAFAGAVATGTTDAADPVVEFVLDVGLSTAIGVGFGLLLAIAVSTSRAGLWRESASLAAAAVVAGSFISIDFAGGSGYLGAFLAGLIVGNLDQIGLALHGEHERELRTAIAAVSEVVVLLVFLGLGVSLPFAAIGDHLPAALLVVAGLVLVARPLTVAACLLADRRARWTREELLFLAWTRETGVVPAALAGLLIAREVPHAELVEVTVAVALVVTLVVQTATKPALARRLGLLESDRPTG